MSKLADYSFILLSQMVSNSRKPWSASDLAAATTLPLPTVAKLMKTLAKGGVVIAHRGATGGYRLARPPAEMTIASIIEAVDGPIALTDCVETVRPDCAVQSLCPMHGGWNKINRTLRGALTSVFLSDLMVFSPEPATMKLHEAGKGEG
ncbi:MAG: SUF system Fe-S cluster assembly regulator [Alphaproteobacteria bacterium]|nr:SUF system Fe-S cluster assembly regulator [Alphaproteobacteria bacterium]